MAKSRTVDKGRIDYYGNRCHMPTETISLDAYILDSLMPDLVGHDRQPSAFLVYLSLWRQTHGSRRLNAGISLVDLAETAGLSKRAVQQALKTLVRRRLVSVSRESLTAIPVYTVHQPWRRS